MKARTGNVRRQRPAPMRQKLCSALLLAMATCTTPAWAQRNDAPQAYSISAGDLASALDQLASQSKVQIIYPAELVRGKRAPAVSGQQTWREALQRLLADTGLAWGFVNDTTVVIRQEPVPAAPQPPAATRNAPTPTQPDEREVQELERLTVTGTRIRGGATPSPVITIGSEQIQEEGFSELGELIRSIPQNFSGGQNPGVLVFVGASNLNITGGSGLNLRGLGPDATLTLLNGRRLSYAGNMQAVDITAIPVEAVERIEIVTDGASAVYGSDAVAGVGNVILRRDFDGVAIGARHGTATDGGLTTREYTATAGTTWSSGGLIVTYKDSSSDPIYAGQRKYTEYMLAPQTLYPRMDLRSGLVSAYQSFGGSVEFRLDALRKERGQEIFGSQAAAYLSVSRENSTTFISPSLDFSLPNDWTISIGGAWSDDKTYVYQTTTNRATGASPVSVDLCYCNEGISYEAGAEGPLFSLPGGDARLAIGAGYRTVEYFQPNYLTGAITTEGEESSRFAYAEIGLPLVGPESGMVGVRRLALTAAVRGEDYDSFGSVTTPKLGLLYGPSADFTLKGSWGRSFKAPTLSQRYASRIAVLYSANSFGADYPGGTTVLGVFGGNPDLDAERARTWTTSLAFHPEALPGLELELTWFDIDYINRVVTPVGDFFQGLANPVFAEFVEYSPSMARQDQILASLTGPFSNLSGSPYDPSQVVAMIVNSNVNSTRQSISGLDLTGSYRLHLDGGQLTIRGALSWLDSTQQTLPSDSAHDLSGTRYNPADFNGRLGAIWNRGGFTASTFVNHTGGVTNTVTAESGASFTTFDATLRYRTGERDDAWSGLEFSLSAQNLFDRAPPTYAVAQPTIVPFDTTNYSAIGRFVNVAVSKRW